MMNWWLLIALALATAYFLVKSRWNYLRLEQLALSGQPLDQSVTVVIPARNEERNIARAAGSFPGARVLVVDDGSTDDTARLARESGAEVLEAGELPPGWLGKPHACWKGALAASTEWILFVDADTWYDRNFLQSLVEYAIRNRLDMVSVFPRQVCESLAERVLLPYAFALYFCGVSATAVHHAHSRQLLANGQCILFRRAAYFACGGHRAVCGSVIEDMELAALARRAGLAFRVIRSETMASVRMYDGLAAIWRGFQKNSFRFLVMNPSGGWQVVLASVLLTSYLPVLAALWAASHGMAAFLWALLPGWLLMPWYGGAASLLFAPVAIYLFQAIALNGMFTTLLRRKAIWKGRPV